MTASNTAHPEFEAELEGERLRMLRLRFLWMCGIYLAMASLSLPLKFIALWTAGGMRGSHLLHAWWGVGWFAVYVGAMVFALVRARRRRTISAMAMTIIVLAAVAGTPEARVEAQLEGTYDLPVLVNKTPPASTRHAASSRATSSQSQPSVPTPTGGNPRNPGKAQVAFTRAAATRPPVVIQLDDDENVAGAQRKVTEGISRAFATVGRVTPAKRAAANGIFLVFWAHLVACIFMPWTLRESAAVAIAALSSYGAVVSIDAAAGNLHPAVAAVGLALTAIAMLPGLGLCWWRHSSFRSEFRLQFESGRYRELRGELESARRIHESCLPAPMLSGPLRMAYAYRPMRDIGGDMLFRRQFGNAHLIVIVDVTGHGIAAALTVNRLLGELERVVGEAQDPMPGEILASLNAYACLMLAEHGLYLSALVIRAVEDAGELTYASGGHPTAYVVSLAGETRELCSTAPLLGILPPGEYEAREEIVVLAPGETLVACTDGATETTQRDGTMLRTAGMRNLVEEIARSGGPVPEAWPEILMRRLDGMRAAEVEDDTLVITISRA